MIFSGMGGDWPGMGYDLYKNSKVFEAAWNRCTKYLLEAWNCDSTRILVEWQHSCCGENTVSEGGKSPFRNVVDATVCLTTLQICLIDLLRAVNFTRGACDGYIGHSTGEIAAGYFDGCLTWKETLDVSYLRGRTAAEIESNGCMKAFLGVTRDEIESALMNSTLPLDVACHNGPENVTLSGTEAELLLFEEALRDTHPSVSVVNVRTYGVAFHSRLLDTCVMDEFETNLRKVIGEPKIRSTKWRSTCCDSNEAGSDYAGPAYYTNGFRRCVEFDRAVKKIPDNAVVVECGPCGLFRNLFKKRDHSNYSARYISLMERGKNSIESLGVAYGQLFLHGIFMSDSNKRLSPQVVFPKPTQRAIREAFFGWDHRLNFVDTIQSPRAANGGSPDYCANVPNHRCFEFDFNGRDSWLRHHIVAGRCLFPAGVYLAIIQEVMSLKEGQQCVLENFTIHSAVDISDISALSIRVVIEKTNPVLLLTNNVKVALFTDQSLASVGTLLVSCDGVVDMNTKTERIEKEAISAVYDSDFLDATAIYQQLGRHGYDYGNSFRVLSSLGADRAIVDMKALASCQMDISAKLKMWSLLFDGVLQFSILQDVKFKQYGQCQLPVGIDKIIFCQSTVSAAVGSATFMANNGAFDLYARGSHVSFCGVKLHDTSTDNGAVEVTSLELAPVPENGPDILPHKDMEVVYLRGDTCNFDIWRPTMLALQRPLDECSDIGQLCVVISSMAGFSGFVRSLQQEPGYSHIRGLQVHSTEDYDRIGSVIEKAFNIFYQRGDAICLYACDDFGAIVLKEDVAQLGGCDSMYFPAPHGCFLAVSGHGSEKPYCWKPIVCPTYEADYDDTSECDVKSCKIEVAYASLNFRDVMLSTEKLQRNEAVVGYGVNGGGLGLDFSGYRMRENGSELCTRTKCMGLGRDCVADMLYQQPEYLLWDLPDSANLEKMATVPCAYGTAYYALCMRGNMKNFSKVLVHCGAGGVGLASLYICKNRLVDPTLQLFVTCSDDKKRKYVNETFGIPLFNIGDSRSSSFLDMVRRRTNNVGVDIVLNSLTGPLMEASIACLGFGGILLELGKGHIEPGVLRHLRTNDRQISLIDLDQLMASRNDFSPLREMVDAGLKNGEIVPLVCENVCAATEIDTAFARMSSRSRIGKIVVNMKQGVIRATTPSMLATLPLCKVKKKQIVIIVGGMGGLGLCFAQWIASRLKSNAMLILCSRHKKTTQVQQQVIVGISAEYKSTVKICSHDFSDRLSVDNFLQSLCDDSDIAEVFGFFNLAVANTYKP